MARKIRRAPVKSDKRFKKRMAADTGPEERWQHSRKLFYYTEQAGVVAAQVSEEHVLDTLLHFSLIEARLRDAGLRLQQDYVLARMEDRVSASYSGMRGGTRDPEARLLRNEAEEAAYGRWRAALAAVSPLSRDILIHVACIGLLPDMAMIARFKAGLRDLARYYRLPE